MQSPFVLENLPLNSPRKLAWNQMRNAVKQAQGLTNLRVPSFFQGCLSRNQHWKNTNIFCRVNEADHAQYYWPVCQNLGVPCPKRLSCKCAFIFNFFLAKQCWIWFYGSHRVVLCKRPRAKTPNTRGMRAFLKILHFGKPIALAKWANCFQLFFFWQKMLNIILRKP